MVSFSIGTFYFIESVLLHLLHMMLTVIVNCNLILYAGGYGSQAAGYNAGAAEYGGGSYGGSAYGPH